MALFWQTAALVLLALVLGLTLEKQQKDLALVLRVAVCVITVAAALSFLSPVVDFARKLCAMASLDSGLLGTLFKAAGIGMMTQVGALVCEDAGNGAAGKGIQLLGTAVILWLSIPIFETLMSLIQGIMGGL
jgi:stage III sporulation protein AD